MFNKLKISLIILLTFIATTSFAWWDSTHMVIVKIAEENLSKKAKIRSYELTELLKDFYPESPDFITAATWADDVASTGFTGWDWHGKSLPYDPDNYLTTAKKNTILASLKNNAVYGIDQAIKTLKNPDAHEYSKAIMLRFLLHALGDIHMPLHCTSLYSKDFPSGDFGGGKFKLNIDLNGKNSLHALWDSCLMRDGIRLDRPLTDEGIVYLEDFKNEITTLYPKKSIDELDVTDFDAWVFESHQIGCENSYYGIKLNDTPSDEYLQKNRQIAYRQVAKAGYRLADVLNEVFKD
ncbi:MAG: hypothetical protein K1060chlam1_00955 [Candidatus Anoxychlamydiales bacterium]|nr:hypothetical protein [Candidatus Anoxychlamydiales bacterium]